MTTEPLPEEAVTEAIDPASDASAIARVEILALAAPFSTDFANDLLRVCKLAMRAATQPTAMPGIRRVVHELRLSARVFRDYAQQHEDKARELNPGGSGRSNTGEVAERLRKAKRNRERAMACEAALEAFDAGVTALPEEEVMRRCYACGGSGYNLQDVRKYGDLQKRCEVCKGSGRLPLKPKVDVCCMEAPRSEPDCPCAASKLLEVDEDAEWLRNLEFVHEGPADRTTKAVRLERIAARLEDGQNG